MIHCPGRFELGVVMRGSDDRSGSLFSYVDLGGSGSAGSSVADDPGDRERGAGVI